MKNGIAILVTMLAGVDNFSYRDPSEKLSIEFRGVSKLSEEQKAIKKGLKKFEYPKGVVYALNQKKTQTKRLRNKILFKSNE